MILGPCGEPKFLLLYSLFKNEWPFLPNYCISVKTSNHLQKMFNIYHYQYPTAMLWIQAIAKPHISMQYCMFQPNEEVKEPFVMVTLFGKYKYKECGFPQAIHVLQTFTESHGSSYLWCWRHRNVFQWN